METMNTQAINLRTIKHLAAILCLSSIFTFANEQNLLKNTQEATPKAQNNAQESPHNIQNTKDSTQSTQHSTPKNPAQEQESQAAQNLNKTPKTKQFKTLTTDFGIGYITTNFTSEQEVANYIFHTPSSRSHGVEIFSTLNFYLHRRFALTFGVGLEFLPIYWETPLYEVSIYGNYTEASQDEFLVTGYITIGAFIDILALNNHSLKLLANIGLSQNAHFKGLYNGHFTSSGYGYYSLTTFTPELKIPITLPLTFGARYSFKNHGIEVVGKVHFSNMSYEVTGSYYIRNTIISREISIGARYVYEFQW